MAIPAESIERYLYHVQKHTFRFQNEYQAYARYLHVNVRDKNLFYLYKHYHTTKYMSSLPNTTDHGHRITVHARLSTVSPADRED